MIRLESSDSDCSMGMSFRGKGVNPSYTQLAQPRKALHEFVMSGGLTNNDHFYIVDNQLCVDFVIRYENLSEDLMKVCERIGRPPIDLPHLKTGFRQKRHHYSEYFDEESKALVAEKHKNDIRLFGYEFG